MTKLLLTVCCAFGLLLSSASAQEDFRLWTLSSGSMLPTVPEKGFILVNTLFPAKQLRIGDVVTFYLPKDKSTAYAKRIVGMGGDRIQMVNAVLHINGQAVKRERVEDYVEEGVPGKPIQRWRETLPNGVSHMTLDMVDNGFYDNTPVYLVPADHYFMMGDNRDNSTDSRVLGQMGYVPVENIIGKAYSFYHLSMGYISIQDLDTGAAMGFRKVPLNPKAWPLDQDQASKAR